MPAILLLYRSHGQYCLYWVKFTSPIIPFFYRCNSAILSYPAFSFHIIAQIQALSGILAFTVYEYYHGNGKTTPYPSSLWCCETADNLWALISRTESGTVLASVAPYRSFAPGLDQSNSQPILPLYMSLVRALVKPELQLTSVLVSCMQ